MATTARLTAAIALWVGIAGAGLAQTSPQPGPTVPPLRVPKPGENLVINPTMAECKAGWRPGLRWTKEEFRQFCAQLKISK
jgi:hypothetical protein